MKRRILLSSLIPSGVLAAAHLPRGRPRSGRSYVASVHGSSILLERNGILGKKGVEEAFQNHDRDGDIVQMKDSAACACYRTGLYAQLVPFDSGGKNKPKSGSFYVHYAIPVTLTAGVATTINDVFIFARTTNAAQLTVERVHLNADGAQLAVFEPILKESDDKIILPPSQLQKEQLVVNGRLAIAMRISMRECRDQALTISGVSVHLREQD